MVVPVSMESGRINAAVLPVSLDHDVKDVSNSSKKVPQFIAVWYGSAWEDTLSMFIV